MLSATIAAGTVALLFPVAVSGQETRAAPRVVPPSAAYIGEASESHGHVPPRWQTQTGNPRTLWVHLEVPPPDRPTFWTQVERALGTWNEVSGVPLSFRLTERAAAADVTFRWVRRFSVNQAGTTDWRADGEGRLASVVVTLAVEHSDGTPMSDEFLLLVALHELGHAIGLPHSENPLDVMHPGNRSRALSDRDVRSAQQLYSGESGDPTEAR